MDEHSCLIDGFGPLPIVQPDTVSALGEVVRQAAAEQAALYPVGGQTMLNLGGQPTTRGKAVALHRLSEVIDFPARDMTITVQAGIKVAKLQEILAREKLRLPIDVPRSDEATLGGILATNTSGSRRYGFGTLRDYVIGISAVNDAGSEFKAGGRVVKNVAGYDLCKLLVGSLGTLGIITQVTLKLRPLPEEQALVTLACAANNLETVLNQLHGSRTRPVCLDLLNDLAAREIMANSPVERNLFRSGQRAVAERDETRKGKNGINSVLPEEVWVAVVGFEGNAEAVNWQVQQLVREVGAEVVREVLVGSAAVPLWQALAEWNLWPKSNLTFRANLLPSGLASFCVAVAGLAEKPWLRAHAGNGIVTGHFETELARERAAHVLAAWRDLAGKSEGRVVMPRCPAGWKPSLSVWGPAPADAWLMRDVKKQFDPRRVFNPGRFVDGI